MKKKINKPCSPWPGQRVQFLTICTYDRQLTLGHIDKIGETFIWHPSPWGVAAEKVMKQIQESSKQILVLEYAVMPNHIHLLIIYKRCYEDLIKQFIIQCKHTLTQSMIKAMPANDPIWEKSFAGQLVRREQTQHVLCQNLREHKKYWHYDSLYVHIPKRFL